MQLLVPLSVLFSVLKPRFQWLLFFLFAFLRPAFPQVITTVAGSGFNGISGDGGLAVNAGTPYPSGICMDLAGNLYLTCTNNVRKIAAGTGIITNFAGNGNPATAGDGGPATGASMRFPVSVCADNAGNVYIAEYSGHCVRKVSPSGIITTVAGNGTAGYGGDGGPATAAGINQPWGVTIDNGGNLYIADYANYRIRKVAAGTGIISTVAGTGTASFSGDGGPAVNAGIAAVTNIFAAPNGDVYFTEAYAGISCRVRKIAAGSGIITTVAGNGSNNYSGDGGPALGAGLFDPSGIAVDAGGNIYISTYDDSRIRKVTAATGIITTLAGNGSSGFGGDGGPAANAVLNRPKTLLLDASGALYIADNSNHRIRKITGSVACTPAINISSSTGGVVCSGQPIVFTATVANEGTAPVYQWLKNNLPVGTNAPSYTDNSLNGGDQVACKLTSNAPCANGAQANSNVITVPVPGIIGTVAGNGTAAYAGDGGPASLSALNFPYDVCFDAAGNAYVVDGSNNRIRKIDASTGVISTIAGTGTAGFSGDGGPATAAQLNNPGGIGIDAAGNLYLADRDNHRIRKIVAATGVIITVAGNGSAAFSGDGGPALNAALSYPLDVVADASDNLYIADRQNNRIRKVTAVTGIITTVAGTGIGTYNGGGGPATAINLSAPTKIIVDPAGNPVIADWANHCIRKLTVATGILSTLAGTGAAGSGGNGGPATAAQLNYPTGICFDPAGNLFIGDVNQVVRRVDAATGLITRIAGTSNVAGFSGDGAPATAARLNGPSGMSCDPWGTIYFCDLLNHRVRKIYNDPYPASAPTLAASPQNACAGSNVTLSITGGSLNQASGWKWYTGSCGGSLAGAGPSLTVSPTVTTTYFARGEGTCVAPGPCAPITVAVTPAAAPSVSVTASSNLFCFSQQPTFTVTVSGITNPVYQWKKNGIAVGANNAVQSIAVAVNDVITCSVSGNGTCGAATALSNGITILSNPGYNNPPEVTIAASAQTVCAGTAVAFTATNVSASAVLSWQWLLNGVPVGTNSPGFSSNALKDGDKVECIMFVPDCPGGSTKDYSDPIIMKVNPVLNPAVNIATPTTSVCKGTAVTFTASASQSGNNSSYQWKINGVNAGSNSATFTTTALANGDAVTCELSADASVPCVSNNKVGSNVVTMNVQNVPAPQVQISTPQAEVCAGTPVTFTAAVTNAGTASYQWQVNGNNTGSNAAQFTASALADGDKVSCVLTPANASCASATASNVIVLKVQPLPVIRFNPSTVLINPGTQAQLKATVQGNVVWQQWTPSALLTNATSLTPLTVPLITTTRFQLNVKTAIGCEDKKEVVVTVYSRLYMPNSFTPNGDGKNDLFQIPPGSAIELSEFSVYDRWGAKVFTTTDAGKGWDGKARGLPVTTNTFVYVVRGRDYYGDVFLKGTVLLIR